MTMEDILIKLTPLIEAIVKSPYTALLGITLSIVGFIGTIYYRQKTKRFKHLACVIFGNNIVRDRQVFFPKLSVRYEGDELDSLTISKVRIRNLGNEIIRKDDVAPNDPIRVTIDPNSGERILDCSLIESSKPAINFGCSLTGQTVNINFDFMEPDDVAYCQIIHTGKNHQALKVSGTIIGAKKPFQNDDPIQLIDRSFFRLATNNPLLSGSVVMLIVAIVNIFLALSLTPSIIVRSLCMIPAILLLVFILRVAIKTKGFRKSKDKTSETFFQEMVIATMSRNQIPDD